MAVLKMDEQTDKERRQTIAGTLRKLARKIETGDGILETCLKINTQPVPTYAGADGTQHYEPSPYLTYEFSCTIERD